MLLFFFRTVPQRMWSHFWKVSTQGLFVAMFWPLIPQFVCNCLFYWALYFNPIINIDLVVKEVRRLETQVFWVALPTLWGTPPASLTSELWCLSEEGLGAHNFLFSFPSKQGAAFSVKAYNQVLSPSALVIVAAGTDPRAGPAQQHLPPSLLAHRNLGGTVHYSLQRTRVLRGCGVGDIRRLPRQQS